MSESGETGSDGEGGKRRRKKGEGDNFSFAKVGSSVAQKIHGILLLFLAKTNLLLFSPISPPSGVKKWVEGGAVSGGSAWRSYKFHLRLGGFFFAARSKNTKRAATNCPFRPLGLCKGIQRQKGVGRDVSASVFLRTYTCGQSSHPPFPPPTHRFPPPLRRSPALIATSPCQRKFPSLLKNPPPTPSSSRFPQISGGGGEEKKSHFKGAGKEEKRSAAPSLLLRREERGIGADGEQKQTCLWGY